MSEWSRRQKTSTPGVYVRITSSGKRVYDITFSAPSGTGEGRKKRWEYGFATKKAAEDRRSIILGSVAGQKYVVPSKITLGDYAKQQLESRYAVGAIRESSFRGDLRLLLAHLPDDLWNMPIQRVTRSDLNNLWSDLANGGRKDGRPGGLSPRTVERLHSLLLKTLYEAVQEDLVIRNVAWKPRLPKRTKKAVRAMSAREVRQLLSAARDDWFYALFYLAVTTGMRRGELCGLTWNCVDLDAGELRVENTLLSIEHRPVWSTAKTDDGHRTIALDPRSVEVLREQRKKVLEAKLLHGQGWGDSHDLVFPQPDGSTYNPEIISMRFGRLVKRAGLPHYSLHALRHTYATLARRQGMDIKALKDRLGHSTVSITMDLYQHVPQDMARQAANDVARFILGDA